MTEQEDKDKKPAEPTPDSAEEISAEELLSWIDAIEPDEPLADMPTMTWAVDEPEVPEEAESGSTEHMPDAAPADEPPRVADQPDAPHTPPFTDPYPEPLETLEDAIDWLEKLAAGEGTPLEEMPTMLTGPGGPGADGLARKPPAEAVEGPADIDSQIDPVDWLEQLAADQSSPLEELPSVANRLLESEIVSQIEIDPATGAEAPAAIDAELIDALAYLEALARAKGIELERVALPQAARLDDLPVRLAELDHVATGEQPTLVVPPPEIMLDSGDTAWHDLSTQMPEDPAEALDWLGRLTGEAELTEAELVAAVEEAVVGSQEGLSRYEDADPVTADAEESAADEQLPGSEHDSADVEQVQSVAPPIVRTGQQQDEQSSLDSRVLDEMPEDPDEAMVWMETLAGRSTAGKAGAEDSEDANVPHALSATEAETLLASYRERIEAEEDLTAVVAKLETMLSMQPQDPRLRRLLGDAYVADGQIEKALETYRGGLG